jgi:hypothetical protein
VIRKTRIAGKINCIDWESVPPKWQTDWVQNELRSLY